MNEPSLVLAFATGILSFLSPCILPVLPAYLSYLAGVTPGKSTDGAKAKIFTTNLAFVLGFLVVLVVLGAAASAAGQLLLRNRALWQRVGGLLIIAFGLQALGLLRLPFLQRGRELNLEKFAPWGKGKAFLAGSSLATSWSPCIGPLLGCILVLAAQSQTLARGVGLLISYALGLSIPMLLSGFFFARLKILRNRYVPAVSGAILVALGLLLFSGQYGRLSAWITQGYRFLGIPTL